MMKKAVVFQCVVICCLLAVGCNKGQEINGHNIRTADKSVKFLKERLPPEDRLQFEVSYWTIRDDKKNPEEFLETVDGKTPYEIIALGKQIYQQRKENGYQAFAQYGSWEEMISKYVKDRMDQDSRRAKKSTAGKENSNQSVLYDLRR